MEGFEKLEYQRISKEIQSDRETQFRIFTQTLLGIGAIFLVIFMISPIPFDELSLLLFLPIWVLSHVSLTIIYNRGRSHNRKSAYLLVAYTKYSATSSWERDMLVLRWRTEGVHRPETFRQMSIVLWMIQIAVFIFIILNTYINGFSIGYSLIGIVFAPIFTWAIMIQIRNFFCLKYRDSIQGFAEYWSAVLNLQDWRYYSWLSEKEIPDPWLPYDWYRDFKETPVVRRFLFRLFLHIPKFVEEVGILDHSFFIRVNYATLILFTFLIINSYSLYAFL